MNRLWVRLTLAFVAVTLVGVAIVAAIADWSANNTFRQYLARQDALAQSGVLEALSVFYQQRGTWDGVDAMLINANLVVPRGRGQGGGASGQGRGRPPLALADANGVIVFDERGAGVGTTISAEDRTSALFVVANGKPVGYLMFGAQGRGALAPAEQAFLDQLRIGFVIAGLVAVVLGVVLAIILSRTLAAPLANVVSAARKFAAHDWQARVPVRGADEIAEVAREFNAMADDLQRAETLRRNLMADIAHELRTPITVLQGNLSAMLDEVYPLNREEIATLFDETRVLARLVNDLRELSLAEAGQLPLNLQSVNVAEIARTAVANFSVAAEAQAVQITLEATQDLNANADPDRLTQVLLNLISNALRHTPSNGKISIQCSAINEQCVVSVTDTGEGIMPEDVPHVFDRFYRGDKSRARERGGTGLGLAIVKSLVEAMGGSIGVESERGKGSRFWFTLAMK